MKGGKGEPKAHQKKKGHNSSGSYAPVMEKLQIDKAKQSEGKLIRGGAGTLAEARGTIKNAVDREGKPTITVSWTKPRGGHEVGQTESQMPSNVGTGRRTLPVEKIVTS